MAIKGAVRWRPDMNRPANQTSIQGFDPTATPPTGEVVMIAQAVAYDDAAFNAGNPYKPGKPATEQELVLLWEEPVTIELAAFVGLSVNQGAALWNAELLAFKEKVLPAGPILVVAIRSARIAPPILI